MGKYVALKGVVFFQPLLSSTGDGCLSVCGNYLEIQMIDMEKFVCRYHVHYVVAAGLVLTGQGLGFVAFVMKYPSVLIQLITFSLCSAIGQVTLSL